MAFKDGVRKVKISQLSKTTKPRRNSRTKKGVESEVEALQVREKKEASVGRDGAVKQATIKKEALLYFILFLLLFSE